MQGAHQLRQHSISVQLARVIVIQTETMPQSKSRLLAFREN
jgi:hypothetical protein